MSKERSQLLKNFTQNISKATEKSTKLIFFLFVKKIILHSFFFCMILFVMATQREREKKLNILKETYFFLFK